MPHGCVFNPKWIEMDQFKSWVRPVASSTNQAFCRLCQKNIDIASMGVQALRSHAKWDKHRFRDGTMAGSDTLGLVQCTLDTQINRPKPKKSEALPSTSSSLGLSQRSSTENDPIALSSAATSPSQSVSQSAQRPVHLHLLFLLGNRLTRRQSAMMIHWNPWCGCVLGRLWRTTHLVPILTYNFTCQRHFQITLLFLHCN